MQRRRLGNAGPRAPIPWTVGDDLGIFYYAHSAYTRGWPSQGEVTKAVFGMEHFLPEVKPLNLARRCVRGWARLCPPQPAAPMPRDLVLAVAAVLSLLGEPGAALAVLVSFDC